MCGYHGSSIKQCKCSPLQVENYVGKISGPLLDRIAIHVTAQPVDVEAWEGRHVASRMTSAGMREQVERAREIQSRRFVAGNGVDCNARISERAFASLCPMEPAAERAFILAQKNLRVSARARGHIVRVARTAADLDNSERITERHLTEALAYRGRDSR